MDTVQGWRGGEVSAARTAGSTVEVHSVRTPEPGRKQVRDAWSGCIE